MKKKKQFHINEINVRLFAGTKKFHLGGDMHGWFLTKHDTPSWGDKEFKSLNEVYEFIKNYEM